MSQGGWENDCYPPPQRATDIKYLDQATGLAMLHRVTQQEADLFLTLFGGDILKAKRMCERVDNGMKFFDVYMIATIARGEPNAN